MRKSGLIAAAAAIALTLPLMAVSASAQKQLPHVAAQAAVPPATLRLTGAAACSVAACRASAGAARPAAERSPAVAVAPSGAALLAPVRVPDGAGPRPGWNGPRYSGGGYGRRYIGPGIGFGTGLLLGGALASQPYYYGSGYGVPYGYDEPYDDGYVYAAPAQGASPDEIAYCQQRYRSYDIRSGTYLNNDGNRYPCP